MKILVTIKRVPNTAEVKIDPVTNTLNRDAVETIMNPYDGYSLEAAARIKDQYPDTRIVALCMGPEKAKSVLRDALAIAADDVYLASDRAFGGSDTLACSYILSEAIKKIEETEGKFDAIFSGKQSIDGDTAQVGPEIAEHLGIPQVTCALKAEPDGDILKVWKETEEGTAIIGVQMPCLVTYTKPAWDPRLPTIKRKLAANRAEIKVLTAEDINSIDTTQTGLKGSPTKVRKTFVPKRDSVGIILKDMEASQAVSQLADLLDKAGII